MSSGYVRDPELASGNSFPIPKETLCNFFEPDNIKDNVSMKKLAEHGGSKKIMQALKTSETNGIDGKSKTELDERMDAYDQNEPIIKEARGIWKLVVECFEDEMLKIITVAAIISIIIGMIKDGPKTGWIEGATIVIAVVIIVAVTAGNNYLKEKQFEKLNKKIDDKEVEVIRNGNIERMSIFELLVGDIVYLNIGDLLPVDALLVEGSEIWIDESSVTGESDLIPKSSYEKCNGKETPFLISGSKVMDGSGKYMVAAVGVNTQYGKLKLTLQEESPLTPLQIKLDSVTQQIGKVGMIVALLTMTVLILHLVYNMIFHKV